MAHDPSPHAETLARFDAVARYLAYLDRRFDDTNHRLARAERSLVTAVDDVGAQVDTALARAARHHVTALVCAQLGQFFLVAAIVAASHLWP